MDKILEVANLSKIYGPGCPACYELTGPQHDTNICPRCGSIVAAHNIAFDLYKGEILGIMGESGSGKSTAVKCLYFAETPSAGQALFFDQGQRHDLFTLNAARQRNLANNRFGMAYQNAHLGLNFEITAGGNIAERLLMSDVNNFANIRARATQLLSRTEVLPERMDELPKNFSGGMQQRVQIAKALATNPLCYSWMKSPLALICRCRQPFSI